MGNIMAAGMWSEGHYVNMLKALIKDYNNDSGNKEHHTAAAHGL